MASRTQSPAPATVTAPDSCDRPGTSAPNGRPAAWWRTRSWRKDFDVLARLRDGLRAIPDDSPGEDQPEAASPPAGPPAESGGKPDASPGASEAEAGSAASPGSAGPDPAMAAIKETFARTASAGDDAAAYFYASLFLRRPGLRELFPPAMDEQRDRLLTALTRIVESLSTPEEMAAYLTQLGRDHRKYAVEPSMYEVVGESLVATLRAFSGDAFTAEAEAAWTQAYAAASGIMIRAAEEDAVDAPAFWTAEVVEREERSHGIAVLTIAPDHEFRYEAGQHVTVQTPRWPRVWRPYSVACAPRDDGLIRLHVRAVPGGWVSNALVSHTEPGDELILGPPLGTMTVRHAEDRDLLCVAGGTGLSPLKAIAEQVIRDYAQGRRRRVFLFYGARCREELYDLRDLWHLADACDSLQVTPVTSDDPAFDGMQGNVGRVAARYLPHQACEAYLAGPPAMVRETRRVLSKAGIPAGRIHFDDALLASRQRAGSGT
jgi:NAD(P)H-flavin reductase/hemoglobin-like flavoprotein